MEDIVIYTTVVAAVVCMVCLFIRGIKDETHDLADKTQYAHEMMLKNVYQFWHSEMNKATTTNERADCLIQVCKAERMLNELMTIDHSDKMQPSPQSADVIPFPSNIAK